MLNIVLFGPPGAGKGTQSKKLTEKYQLVHLSTGDIFRTNLQNETELGLLARSYMDAGQLVPDDVTIQMLEAELNKNPYVKGYIFDGFPRTHAQAEALDTMLQKRSSKVTMMLALEVDEEELKKRLLLRGQDSGRADDQNPEVVQKRIDVYNNETAPVKAYYSAQGKYHGVHGIGEVDEIFSSLCSIVDEFGSGRRAAEKVVIAEPIVEVVETVEEEPKEEIIEISRTIIQETITIKEQPKKIEEKAKVPKQNKVVAAKQKAPKPARPKASVKKATGGKTVKPTRPSGGKATKKSAKKSAKKATKKVAKKSAPKKVVKKTAKKVVKKVVKKVAKKKVIKKAVKKIIKKKAIKKAAKKVVKPARPSGGKIAKKKTVKKVAKKNAKPKAKKVVKPARPAGGKVSKKKKK